MRKIGLLLMTVMACAMLLFGWSGLVQGPEGGDSTPAHHGPENPAMVCAEPVRADNSTLPIHSRYAEVRADIAASAEREQIYLPAMLCDRNGQPMTSLTWWRAVYTSCAPEGLPG